MELPRGFITASQPLFTFETGRVNSCFKVSRKPPISTVSALVSLFFGITHAHFPSVPDLDARTTVNVTFVCRRIFPPSNGGYYIYRGKLDEFLCICVTWTIPFRIKHTINYYNPSYSIAPKEFSCNSQWELIVNSLPNRKKNLCFFWWNLFGNVVRGYKWCR